MKGGRRKDRRVGGVSVTGARLGKRYISSSSGDDDLQLSPCLFAYDAAAAAPVLYGFNLNGSWQKKKPDFCPKCSSGDGKPPRDLTAKATSSKWNPNYTMAVALGSSVYLLGGVMDEEEEKMHHDVSPTRAVYYFDTKRPLEEGWIRGPDMINGRGKDGRAVVVEGKIYVFGGNDCEKAPRPWAEVLDPVKMKWKALPRPPRRSYLDEGFLCAPPVAYDGGPGEGKKIIVGEEGKYVYDLNSEEWEQLSPELQRALKFSGNLAGVGSFLYWTDQGMLFALNMNNPEEKYSARIKGYPLPFYRDNWCYLDEPQLLYLGGNRFCLLKMKELRRDRTKVCLYKLRVSKRDGGFKAYIVGSQTHIFDQPLASEQGLVLEGLLHGVKKENLTKKRKRILV